MTKPTKEQKVDRIARTQRALAFALRRLRNAPRRQLRDQLAVAGSIGAELTGHFAQHQFIAGDV
jgi:hypothetical protein